MGVTSFNLDHKCESLFREVLSKPEYCMLSRSHINRLCVRFVYEFIHDCPDEATKLFTKIKEDYDVNIEQGEQQTDARYI
jgi:hypothetical protein